MKNRSLYAALSAVCCLSSVSASGRLTPTSSNDAVSKISQSESAVLISIKPTGSGIPRVIHKSGKFVLLFPHWIHQSKREFAVNVAGLDRVAVRCYRKGTSAVIFKLSAAGTADVTRDQDQWVVRVTKTGSMPASADNSAHSLIAPAANAVVIKSDVVEAPRPEPKKMVEPPVMPTQNVEIEKGAATARGAAMRFAKAPEMVSLEFVNTDIVQVLRALALQSGTNVITSPDVKGTITVSVKDMPIDDALHLVTGMSELSFARLTNTIIVAPATKLESLRRQVLGEPSPKPEDALSDAYLVQGGSAEELLAAVAGKGQSTVGGVTMLATPGHSTSRQAIVLKGPETEIKALMKTFQELDNADAAIGSYEIYDVKYLDPRSLREELISSFPGLRASVLPASVGNPGVYVPSQITTQSQSHVPAGDTSAAGGGSDSGSAGVSLSGGTSAPVKSAADNRTDRDSMGLTQPFQSFESVSFPMKLVLRGTPTQIDAAVAYLKRIDVAPKQVAIELRVMELTKEDALRIGIDWSILTGSGTVQSIRFNQGLGDKADTSGTINGTFSGPTNVLATLDSAANKFNLIARPNLLAIDGREAELFVGDVIRYIKTIQASQNGTTVETGEERVGVRLSIMPRVGSDGNITLDLRPIVSYLRGYTPVPGGGQLPQTSERVTQTTAQIMSGETLALGGLIQDSDRKNTSGIPFLKDLPVLGQLFRRTDNDHVRTEIVFFLTAKVVDDKSRTSAADPRELSKKKS